MSSDVTTLYSSIPQEQAVQVIRKYMDNCSSYNGETKEFVVLSMEFLLTHNFFFLLLEFFFSRFVERQWGIFPFIGKYLYGHMVTKGNFFPASTRLLPISGGMGGI